MVVFEDGLARKSEYRRHRARALRRRGRQPAGGRHRRHARGPRRGGSSATEERDTSSDLGSAPTMSGTARPPGSIRTPGGPSASPTRQPRRRRRWPPGNAAAAALGDLGIDDVAVVGLAKRLEEVWVPGQDFPVILPRTSEGLYLLQRVRDEAHRFAITFHRQRRSKAMTSSALDGIPGLGDAKRKALLRHFGFGRRSGPPASRSSRSFPASVLHWPAVLRHSCHRRGHPPLPSTS